MSVRHIKNQDGMSLTELLVVSVIGALLLAVAAVVFVEQQSFMKDQRDSTDTRALGRVAMEDLAKILREAGYGLPVGQGITSAGDDSIVFLSNTDNVSANLAADISAGATAFTVDSAASFAAGDKIAVYKIFDASAYDLKTISSIAGNVITVGSAFANSYSTSQSVAISKYRQIALALDNANHTIAKTADSVEITEIPNVATNGLSLVYKDNSGATLSSPVATPANIRKIEITLNMLDPENPNTAATFKTDVNLRNMGT